MGFFFALYASYISTGSISGRILIIYNNKKKSRDISHHINNIECKKIFIYRFCFFSVLINKKNWLTDWLINQMMISLLLWVSFSPFFKKKNNDYEMTIKKIDSIDYQVSFWLSVWIHFGSKFQWIFLWYVRFFFY